MQLLLKPRVLAIAVLLILVTVVAVAGVYTLQAPARPQPEVAPREEVLRYLVLGDLGQEPQAYQVAMVDRLMQELADTPELPTQSVENIPEGYRQQLTDNLSLLKQAWFYSRCERFHELDDHQQNAFLDKQISAVLTWSRFDLELNSQPGEETAEAQRAAYAREFFGEIETWIAAADEPQQPLLTQAVRRAIIRWLATRDLQQEPLGTRQALAGHIVAELDRGMRLEQVIDSLQEPQQEMLTANSLLLLEAWLHELAKEYEALPTDERTAYVDRRLEQVMQWDLASLMADSQLGNSGSTAGPVDMQATMKLMAVIGRWIERADEESRPRFEAFMRHLQQRWIAQQLGA